MRCHTPAAACLWAMPDFHTKASVIFLQTGMESQHCNGGRTHGSLWALTCFGGEVNAQRRDGVIGRVVIEFSHEEIVVLHPQRELLHV